MAVVLAQMMDRGDMGDGSGHWWWWLLGFALFAMLVVVIIWMITRNGSQASVSAPHTPRRSAEDGLADRFARGEIDEAEYRRRRDALRE